MKQNVRRPFPRPQSKWKDCQMDPIGFCFAESLREIKHFQDFKKAEYCRWDEMFKHPFSNTIYKMERIKWSPFGSAIAVPSGDKTFSRFQKADYPPLKRKAQTPFLKHNKMDRIKWTPFGSGIAVPSGDKTFSRFQKDGLPPLKRTSI